MSRQGEPRRASGGAGRGRLAVSAAAWVLLLLPLAWGASPAHAQAAPIEVLSSSIESEFPGGMRFALEARVSGTLASVAARCRLGQQTSGAYQYLDLQQQGDIVDAALFWRTNSADRYVPPGTIATCRFELEDADGNTLTTEPTDFVYADARFEWEEVSQGPVAVAFHGGQFIRPRAEEILQTILQTLDTMGPLLGADITLPIRVTMYNNVKEMLDALPPQSAAIRRELITEGQAFADFGVLLLLGSGRLANGTAAHEVTHIVTHRAAEGLLRRVPSWLDEGLAEFGNPEPGYEYDLALDFAKETGSLMPITTMATMPGTPEDVIIFYGEARSIVQYMVFGYGPDKMRALMAALKSDKNMDDALREVYGVSALELENGWRQAIGAPAYAPPQPGTGRPTPLPRPAVLPYSLTPQPHAAAVGASQPTPSPTTTQEPAAAATPEAATPTSQETTPASAEPSAGGCVARPGQGAVPDASLPALAVGLAGLGWWTRRHGR